MASMHPTLDEALPMDLCKGGICPSPGCSATLYGNGIPTETKGWKFSFTTHAGILNHPMKCGRCKLVSYVKHWFDTPSSSTALMESITDAFNAKLQVPNPCSRSLNKDFTLKIPFVTGKKGGGPETRKPEGTRDVDAFLKEQQDKLWKGLV